MKIAFYPLSCVPFHGGTLKEKPLGGIETAVIHFSEALASLGHEVYVLSPLKSFPPSNLKNPKTQVPKVVYLNFKEKLNLPSIDVLIVVRDLKGLLEPIKARKRFLWMGDAATNRHTLGIGDRRFIDRMDGAFFVSEWQRETVCTSSGLPLEKAFILRNGVDLQLFAGEEERVRKRLIYASNPQRGLIGLPRIFFKAEKTPSRFGTPPLLQCCPLRYGSAPKSFAVLSPWSFVEYDRTLSRLCFTRHCDPISPSSGDDEIVHLDLSLPCS